MSFNSIGNFNKSFVGPSSAKPICGQYLDNFYKNSLVQARLDIADAVAPGQAVNIKTANTSGGAGNGLNPNVLIISSVADTSNAFEGFLLASETDVLHDDETAPRPVKSQIVNVAILGSGQELYLPCDASLQNKDITTAVYWDVANAQLTTTSTNNVLLNITLLSNVVDGVQYKIVSGKCNFADTKCIKVRI